MSSFTPGPWAYHKTNGSPTHGEHMISGAKPGYLAEVRDCGSGDVKANARLIAAAPELLEALCIIAAYPIQEFALEDKPERKLFGANDWWLHVKDVLAARAAIAKATGEQA